MGVPIQNLAKGAGSWVKDAYGNAGGLSGIGMGLLGAGAGAGLSGFQSSLTNKNSNQQTSITQAANARNLALQQQQQARQNQMATDAMAGFLNDSQSSAAQLAEYRRRSLAAQYAANAILGSPVNTAAPMELNTIASSPAGDFSRPNLGRTHAGGG